MTDMDVMMLKVSSSNFGIFSKIFFFFFSFFEEDKKTVVSNLTSHYYFSRVVLHYSQRTERRKPTTRRRRNSPLSFEALLKKRHARYDDFHADAMRRNRDHCTRHRDIKGAEGAPNEHQSSSVSIFRLGRARGEKRRGASRRFKGGIREGESVCRESRGGVRDARGRVRSCRRAMRKMIIRRDDVWHLSRAVVITSRIRFGDFFCAHFCARVSLSVAHLSRPLVQNKKAVVL